MALPGEVERDVLCGRGAGTEGAGGLREGSPGWFYGLSPEGVQEKPVAAVLRDSPVGILRPERLSHRADSVSETPKGQQMGGSDCILCVCKGSGGAKFGPRGRRGDDHVVLAGPAWENFSISGV